MDQFVDFAYLYDKLNVYYDKKTIIERIRQLFCSRREVVDLCCGTGDVAIAMAKYGFRVTGVDISADMLNVATEKAMQSAARVMFLREDARDLKLMHPVDGIYSLTDGMNYISQGVELETVFKAAAKALKTNGLFAFDVSTEYKYKNVLNGKTFTFDYDDVFVSWHNEYDENKKKCVMNVTGFIQKNGLYERFDEEHIQYCHSVENIKISLETCGFEVCGIFSGYTENEYSDTDERIFITAVKK